MDRQFYLDLAARGKRFPIATHLVLHEKNDPEGILCDGKRLAAVMAETAKRFDTPLALPVMDLTLEKGFMIEAMGLATGDTAGFHFDGPPSAGQKAGFLSSDVLSNRRIRANCEALSALAAMDGIIPVGMSIGPFSLLTKLLQDPIIPIYLAGSGTGPGESEEVALLLELLPLCEHVIHASCLAQIRAGAKAVFVCEPAANLVFFSPNQLEDGSTVFHDFVIEPNLRLKRLLDANGADLVFHDCGELTGAMVKAFAVLDPAIMSFGSPVKLWEIEPFVPKTTVLYGNLPTKKFYSDEIPLHAVSTMIEEIETKLKGTGHPFIIGSECDVLSMPGYEKVIMEKVSVFGGCCGHGTHR